MMSDLVHPVKIDGLLSQEMSKYFLRLLMFKHAIEGNAGDPLATQALTVVSHPMFLDVVMEQIWGRVEDTVGEALYPSYGYARLHCNGNTLERHSDKGFSEISVTIQLGRTHDYRWPIHYGDEVFELDEGCGVIAEGSKIDHWREPCGGPDGYITAQASLFFVRANGLLTRSNGDGRFSYMPFVKDRVELQDFVSS